MHSPEALILRRCYPVPVTFADMRAAYRLAFSFDSTCRAEMQRQINRANKRPNASKQAAKVTRWLGSEWASALKEVTGALDEVYAVVDGREVRVAIVNGMGEPRNMVGPTWQGCSKDIFDIVMQADRAGYWARPTNADGTSREVRITLQERPVLHDEVAHAVLVGQEHAERHGGAL